MAPNGTVLQGIAPVVEAVEAMQSSGDRAKKTQAVDFLDKFQKTSDAWNITFQMLQAEGISDPARMFAATTLKGKIIYDLHQLPKDALEPLRNSTLTLLKQYRLGPRPIRTQLCVCLAHLAIQMTGWKDVLPMTLAAVGSEQESMTCILEFLRILPEEVTEGRKFNLSEEEVQERTSELLEQNAAKVLQFLSGYAVASPSAAQDPQLMACIQSWTREIPLSDIVESPLFPVLIHALEAPESFDAAVDCLCVMIRETRDVDENIRIVEKLLAQVVLLRPKIATAAREEDTEMFNGIARIFAEAGENWVVLIARMPGVFRTLVEAILETAALDWEKEAIRHTFNFWYELKQYLVLDNFAEARREFASVWSNLVDIMIQHLHFPTPENEGEDLWEGDRNQEDKFREFRHEMGDVLKDCCEVIGPTACLKKTYDQISAWFQTYGTQATATNVPHWQKLEAPLFALRAMGRQVPPTENVMLPQLVPMLVQIPDHQKLRFQAVMALGRYTEWTANHPETMEAQLNYIITAFEHPSGEVQRAAALSFRFFCTDCAALLQGMSPQLQQFYASVLDRLPSDSQEEVTEGVAVVLGKQPVDQVYAGLKAYCDPVIARIIEMASTAREPKEKAALSDKIQLLTIFIQCVQPPVEPPLPNPAVKFCEEIFPVLARVAELFSDFTPILERICRCWRYMVLSYRTAIAPLLPELATKLSAGFAASRQGCFLWATDSIVREFSDDAEQMDPSYPQAIYSFFDQQAMTFLRALNDLPPEELPDVIEDFFRLCQDVLLYHSAKAIPSDLMANLLTAAISTLALLKEEPLMATLHFLRDLLAYGLPTAPFSTFDEAARQTPPEVQAAVRGLVLRQGEQLTQRLLSGMMFTFPHDCYPDASGVLLGLFQLVPVEAAGWVRATLSMVPAGTVAPEEETRLIKNIEQ
ncbi:ARM repeat-containing protein [Trichodelitschia bisporula]|uniref:ARM repeat-containing protein n=1 Tax=Trichodelitschia bisporula TaxID=703511 RepID=A0A6G1HIW9_9PEZI|nr:ARM repeat-containing protein [Trichodelitschia bisporula]